MKIVFKVIVTVFSLLGASFLIAMSCVYMLMAEGMDKLCKSKEQAAELKDAFFNAGLKSYEEKLRKE